MTMKEKDSKH